MAEQIMRWRRAEDDFYGKRLVAYGETKKGLVLK